jgi:predicted RNase H-like HicB family nuclease
MTKPSPTNDFVIHAVWDDDAEVWVAESDDVPGLITEADSRTRLIEKLRVLIPELLELNNRPFDRHEPIDLELHFRREAVRREERIRLPKAA